MTSKISYRAIKSSALSAAITITAVGLASTLAMYFLFSRLFSGENGGILTFIATALSFSISSYVLLVKLFSGLAREAVQRGVADDVR